MASSLDFLQAATINGLKSKFHPSCKSSWPKAKISSKLQVFMAFSQDFFQAATIHGLKQKFPQSCKSSWPQIEISFKLQVFMT
jgi:hypothetical protein